MLVMVVMLVVIIWGVAVDNLALLERMLPQKLLVKHFNIARYVIGMVKDDEWIVDLEQNLLLGESRINYNDVFLDLINKRQISLERILRLISIYCVTHSGIDLEYCNVLRRTIVSNFGAQYALVIENMFIVGLLFPQSDRIWSKIRRDFDLIPKGDTGIGYVFNGYSPISGRIVEYALQISINKLINQNKYDLLLGGWLNKDINTKIAKLKCGSNFHLVQNYDYGNLTDTQIDNLKSIILVVIIGGITYSEIAALRYIAHHTGTHIIITT
ncbi:MAG: hypothetical protein O7C59_05810, partial [Rickettsia endosymbiont of Ixodes persulcatus]|nr:hypothetical protein [Rickettsia endosymbiont of Ixodes persulcatus]